MKSWKINSKQSMSECVNDDITVPKECAKVKIARAGIDASDIATYLGQTSIYPLSPCRIAVGLISESSDITLKKGQRVMLSPYARTSSDCFKTHGVELDGYLSDFANVNLNDIYTLPDGISDESITFIDDIALTIKMHEKLNIEKTQYVLINGCSVKNLIFAQLCIYYQAIPIVVDNDPTRLELASELGIYYQIDTNEEDITSKLKEITSGSMADYLILDTDISTNVDNILYNLGKDGRVGMYGFATTLNGLQGDLSPVITHNLTIYGLNNGQGEIETAINMLATEIVKVDSLIDKVVDISEVPSVFEELSKAPMYLKTIVKC